MNYFKSEKVNDLFQKWISNYPESHHPLDMERFYSFVYSLITENESFDRTIIVDSLGKRLSEDEIDSYLDNYEAIVGFYKYLIKSNLL